MAIIEVKNLHKIYDETNVPVKAVNGIDLKVEKGEFTAIVGPSGSGKTTLLNMIGGLDKPTKGEVVINDTKIHDLKSKDMINFRLMNIGFVFQAYNLIPVLTAKENVAFIMELQKVSRKDRNQRAMELLRNTGIGDKANYRPGDLSGGQQQRVSVARALASKPQFILADEPTANLDSKSTADLLDMMLEMNRESEITFIFSTHDQRVIDRAWRVVTIEDGKISSDKTREN
ncbi:MAG: ABC transporter ATP-binding protein [Bacteroidales bacterium]|nr:ABC transporter ATP-binding protein [Bacteroidales bacterium]MCF8344932.1 ABC transporter ATP-binding protein [Bacteroidales bacterium]MCF8352713.1 ABC transporter ATP-binding protein [Bacteroidales bacterium]MCF8375733.1 ABC transporter ATP-binding protein [Bacteroidales bacterium]MCF8400333.1 ABC transporter ATP-binding protein [Bacteroidales bacterium]